MYESIWICEMTCNEIDLQQSEHMDFVVEVSDQALEAACDVLIQGSTLAFGSYCSPVVLISSRIALDDRIRRPRTGGGRCECQSDFRQERLSASNQIRSCQ